MIGPAKHPRTSRNYGVPDVDAGPEGACGHPRAGVRWRVEGSGRVTREVVRPVAAGYVVVPDGLDAGVVQRLVGRWGEALGEVAAGEGYALGAVFADVRGRGEPGLYALVGHVRRGCAAVVVAPDLPTLTRSACLAGADRLAAARFLRAPVLTVAPAPADLVVPAPVVPAREPAPAGPAPAGTVPSAPAAPLAAWPWPGWPESADTGPGPAVRRTRAAGSARRRRTDREAWW